MWDDRLHALAVAKVLRPHLAGDPRALEELREEAEALERLAHPVLVRGFDAVLEGERPHLLLEHLEGPNLRRLIRRHGAIPLEQLLPLAARVAAALHYIARERWVHLDVKPDNIVMGAPPRLKLWEADDGIVAVTRPLRPGKRHLAGDRVVEGGTEPPHSHVRAA